MAKIHSVPDAHRDVQNQLSKEVWEDRLAMAVSGIPDVMMRALVVAGADFDDKENQRISHIPFGYLRDDQHDELVQQLQLCPSHCFPYAWNLLSARVEKNRDQSEFGFADVNRCKRMWQYVAYVNAQLTVADEEEVELHLARCALCGPLVAMLQTVQTFPKLPWAPDQERMRRSRELR